MTPEIAESISNLARILAAYYLNLVEHGFPPDMAIELVRDFQRLQWERLTVNAPEKSNVQRD